MAERYLMLLETEFKKSNAYKATYLIDLLLDIENTVDVNKYEVNGFNYWPIIRFQLRSLQLQFRNVHLRGLFSQNLPIAEVDNKDSRQVLQEITDFYERKATPDKVKYDDGFISFYKSNKCNHGSANSSALFLSLEKEHFQTLGGRIFAPILDSLMLQMPTKITTSKITIQPTTDPKNWFIPARTVDLNTTGNSKHNISDTVWKPTTQVTFQRAMNIIENCQEIEHILANKYPDYSINTEKLFRQIDSLEKKTSAFTDILIDIKPDILFITSFTGRPYAIWAAKRLGIKVVDVQHGGMNPYNPYCTNWSNIPRLGYDILPDWFWCWTDSSANMINQKMGFQRSVGSHSIRLPHEAITGGNPSYGFWLDPKLDTLEKLPKELSLDFKRFHELRKNKKVVLFALSGAGSLLDEFVIRTIQACSDQCLWLFRFHQLDRNRESELFEELRSTSSPDFIDLATLTPLPILLPNCDVVLTKNSSIAREVIDFGLPSVLLSVDAAEAHSELVDDHTAQVALDERTLLNILSDIHVRTEHYQANNVFKKHEFARKRAFETIGLSTAGSPNSTLVSLKRYQRNLLTWLQYVVKKIKNRF